MDIGRRGIANRLMPSVDGQCLRRRELSERLIGLAASGSEHRLRPCEPEQTHRQCVGEGLASEHRRRLRSSGRDG